MQQGGGAEEVPAVSYQSDQIKTLGKTFTPSSFGINAEVKSEPVSVRLRELVMSSCLIRPYWWVRPWSVNVNGSDSEGLGLSTGLFKLRRSCGDTPNVFTKTWGLGDAQREVVWSEITVSRALVTCAGSRCYL